MQKWSIGRDGAAKGSVIEAAGTMLASGKLVAFPTETVYGLGANALDEEAVKRIFAAKNRPVDNPLIVHIADVSDLEGLLPKETELTEAHQKLIDTFWPGPLTLLFPAGDRLAPSVHPKTDFVAVRLPDHDVARQLIRASQTPIAAPSANTSGRPSPTTADAVVEDLANKIDGLLDGGPCGIGVESTVLLVESERAIILRPGGITQEMIADVVDVPVVFDANLSAKDTSAPLAPGMKYRHYAPDAQVHVWWGEPEDIYAAMRAFLSTEDDHPNAAHQLKVAVIAPEDFLHRFEVPLPPSLLCALDASRYPEALARELYGRMRDFDHAGATDILIHGVDPAHGIGTAVMNRLQKAAQGRVFRV